jgi:putative spermidine/putrescine transport system permease protein
LVVTEITDRLGTGTVAVPSQAGNRGWWRRHHENATSLFAAAPAMLFLFVLYLLPMAILLMQSIEGGSLAHYQKALTDGLYVRVLLDTLLIAAYVSTACLLLGYPVAYFLTMAPGVWSTVGIVFVLLPFWTSILVRTYGWMVLLGRNGIINRALLDAGVINAPLPLLNNTAGVLIGMTHVLLPYMIFPLYAVMKRMDRGLMAAAEGMGASGWQVFRRIYFPLTLPGVLAGVTLVYVLSIGFFITPALLGGGKVIMVAVLIEQQIRTFLNWGFAAALSAVLLTATLLVYLVLRRVLRSNMQWN